MSNIWSFFPLIGSISAVFWVIAVIIIYVKDNKQGRIWAVSSLLTGVLLMTVFIVSLWIYLQRPPMRTLGETRLWYSFFLPVIGLITYLRWKYKWFLGYSVLLSLVFLLINMLRPETYEKVLMPALQSPWFVPHVIVYIFAYALLAASSLVALKGIYEVYFRQFDKATLDLADNLVYIGFSFLTFGLLFGDLWAKEAWGHYWTWDPKETWAFLTWIAYLIYMHFRYYHKNKYKMQLWILAISFGVLLICWFVINYLPSAANSVHVYSN
jgi:ABC-type transport system involved in cytochrome c biogenesis permease subunit